MRDSYAPNLCVTDVRYMRSTSPDRGSRSLFDDPSVTTVVRSDPINQLRAGEYYAVSTQVVGVMTSSALPTNDLLEVENLYEQ